ncbi:MAG: capsule biosynthesis protein CapA [Silicimonas sp.]|nr:capsule biosynthesis protein CapA [Silicimonas sp.]
MQAGTSKPERCFLFLQGPHGPFFSGLGAGLRTAGARVIRLGFNAGDEVFWRGPGYVPFRQPPEELPEALEMLISSKGITDIVLYGSSRPIHQIALETARPHDLTAHVFEEGYLRPYWVTYERDGANAASPVTRYSLAEMAEALSTGAPLVSEAPDRWGDMRAHMFWGAAYHAALLGSSKRYQGFRPHRQPGVRREFWLHFKRLLETPGRAVRRKLATGRVRFGGFPYHLVLLQLAHDANFLDHGPFADQASFLDHVFKGFSRGAPPHHHLVLKAHPLEDGREPLRPLISRLTAAHGLSGRVHFISGGKLAALLDPARSALTVNSTAAEQALWRAMPLKVFGDAVYNRPEFVSFQTVEEFFQNPEPPDRDAYLTYRGFLLATSQVPGGFYGALSRRKLLRQLPDLMLARESPYERIFARRIEADAQHLSVVG